VSRVFTDNKDADRDGDVVKEVSVEKGIDCSPMYRVDSQSTERHQRVK
jgi:hypothetical protein